MSTFVSDTFADADLTLLTAHAGGTGASWSIVGNGGSDSVWKVANSGAATNSTYPSAAQANSVYAASGTPPTSQPYTLSADLVIRSAVANQQCCLALITAAGNDGYRLGYYYAGSGNAANGWYLQALGAGTTLASSVNVQLSPGTYHITWGYDPTLDQHTVTCGGTTLATNLGGSGRAIVKVGIQHTVTGQSTSTTGQHLSALVAATAGSSLAAGTPTAAVASGTSVTVSVAAATGGTSPYSYQLQRAPDSSGSPGTYASVGSALTGQTSSATFPADAGLTTRTKYWYRVAVTDSASAAANSSGVSAVPAVATTYYVSPAGSDAAAGTSAGAAWQTISKVNGWPQSAGDAYLFQGGQSFPGNLVASAPGTASAPVVFGSYGVGKATISCGNGVGLLVADLPWVTVQDLIFAGVGVNTNGTMADASTNKKYAIEFKSTLSSGWLGGVRALRCRASGCYGGVIVHCDAATTPVGFDGVEVGGTEGDPFVVSDGLAFGVFARGSPAAASSGSPYFLALGAAQHRNVHVHHFRISGIYGIPSASDSTLNFWGSGVVIGNTTGGLVESGSVSGCGQNNDDSRGGPCGAWALESDSVVIRSCESHGNATGSPHIDGGGFDLDGGCTNCVVERCYSHGNAGAGFQCGSYAGSSATSGNAFRHNISEGDATLVGNAGCFQLFGTTTGTAFERNTCHLSSATAACLVGVTSGTHSGLAVRDNILISSGARPFVAGLPTSATLRGNLYWSQASTPHWTWNGSDVTTLAALRAGAGSPESGLGGASGVLADPLLPGPGSGGTVDSAAGPNAAVVAYDPPANSPAVAAGAGPTAAASDFHGRPALAGARPTCGAVEYYAPAVVHKVRNRIGSN